MRIVIQFHILVQAFLAELQQDCNLIEVEKREKWAVWRETEKKDISRDQG